MSPTERALLETLERERRQRGLERLHAAIQVEAAQLEAERSAAALHYGTGTVDPYGYGYGYDPFGYGSVGVPLGPGWATHGRPVTHGGGRFPAAAGGFERGQRPSDGRGGAQGGSHLRRVDPAPPTAPPTHRNSLAPPARSAAPAATAPTTVGGAGRR
jgi:hypothetical protein